MATLSKHILSGSTDGMGFLVDQITSGAATTVHTPVTGTTNLDEVWIWGVNEAATASHKLTIEWGAAGAGNVIEFTIDGETGANLIIPGWVIQDGASNLIQAFADTASVISLYGYVNRYTA